MSGAVFVRRGMGGGLEEWSVETQVMVQELTG